MHWFWFYSIEYSSILDEPWLTVLAVGCNGSYGPEGDAQVLVLQYSIEYSSILDEHWLTVLAAGCNGSYSPEGDALVLVLPAVIF